MVSICVQRNRQTFLTRDFQVTTFYHGGKFVLVTTYTERAEQAMQILRECGATRVNRHDLSHTPQQYDHSGGPLVCPTQSEAEKQIKRDNHHSIKQLKRLSRTSFKVSCARESQRRELAAQ